MVNQKAMNAGRFERGIWRLEEGVFEKRTDISRKTFGYFTVTLRVNPLNGQTTAAIRNWRLKWLRKDEALYEDFSGAVASIVEFFEQVDVLEKKFPKFLKALDGMIQNMPTPTKRETAKDESKLEIVQFIEQEK